MSLRFVVFVILIIIFLVHSIIHNEFVTEQIQIYNFLMLFDVQFPDFSTVPSCFECSFSGKIIFMILSRYFCSANIIFLVACNEISVSWFVTIFKLNEEHVTFLWIKKLFMLMLNNSIKSADPILNIQINILVECWMLLIFNVAHRKNEQIELS